MIAVSKRLGRSLALCLTCLLSLGCYASNVVAVDDREVKEREVKVTWRPAVAADLPGFYATSKIEGELAGGVLKAYYLFGAETYSGAALVLTPAGPQFRVLEESGSYVLGEQGLDLRDGSGPVAVDAALGKLRLRSKGSTLIFERVELN